MDLLYKALQIKTISINGSLNNNIGTSQESIVNAILCNIYLNELNFFINKSEPINKLCNEKYVRFNRKFISLLKITKNQQFKADSFKKTKNKLKH